MKARILIPFGAVAYRRNTLGNGRDKRIEFCWLYCVLGLFYDTCMVDFRFFMMFLIPNF